MKQIKGLELRQISSKSFVLEDAGVGVLPNKMITFNSTAAYLWLAIGNMEFSQSDVAELLIKKYSISKEIALEDSKSIIDSWQKAGIVN